MLVACNNTSSQAVFIVYTKVVCLPPNSGLLRFTIPLAGTEIAPVESSITSLTEGLAAR